ncbi:hypothetical protein ACNOYE_19255 [Nannocystaceae bacterium ST9]
MSALADKLAKLFERILGLERADEPVIATESTNVAGEALPSFGPGEGEPVNMIEVEQADGRLTRYPPPERWDDWVEWDAKAWPRKVPRRYSLIPTICFNCESACGLLAYVDKTTFEIRKFEGNPLHPGSRGPIVPRVRPPTIRPTIPSASSTPCSGSVRAARASGSGSPGRRR